MELTVKLSIICLSASVALTSLAGLTSLPAIAIDFGSITKSSAEQLKAAAKDAGVPFQTNAMIEYAAKQLNLSEETVSASFGSLLKVAQDNLTPEKFALISKAVPDAQNYVDKAPKVSKSSMSSLFSSAGEAGKKALSKYFNYKLTQSRSRAPEWLRFADLERQPDDSDFESARLEKQKETL